MAFNEKGKGLGLKSNEEHVFEDEHANDNVGLDERRDELDKFSNECRNGKML